MEFLFGVGLLAAAGYVGYLMGVDKTIRDQNHHRRNNRRH